MRLPDYEPFSDWIFLQSYTNCILTFILIGWLQIEGNQESGFLTGCLHAELMISISNGYAILQAASVKINSYTGYSEPPGSNASIQTKGVLFCLLTTIKYNCHLIDNTRKGLHSWTYCERTIYRD